MKTKGYRYIRSVIAAVLAAAMLSGLAVFPSSAADAYEGYASIILTTHGALRDGVTADDNTMQFSEPFRAKVGTILEITAYGKPSADGTSDFCNGQVSIFFNNDGTSGNLKNSNNGILEFYDGYYPKPTRSTHRVVMQSDITGVVCNPTLDTDLNRWRTNHEVHFNFTNAYNIYDFSEQPALVRFTVKVMKPGVCYVNMLNLTFGHFDYNNGIYHHNDAALLSIKAVGTAPKSYSVGDVNGDGKRDINDATTVQRAVAQLTTLSSLSQAAAEVDGDGKITVNDATIIQKFLAGMKV